MLNQSLQVSMSCCSDCSRVPETLFVHLRASFFFFYYTETIQQLIFIHVCLAIFIGINAKIQPHSEEKKKQSKHKTKKICLSCLRVDWDSLDEDVKWSVLRGCFSVALSLPYFVDIYKRPALFWTETEEKCIRGGFQGGGGRNRGRGERENWGLDIK